MVTVVWGRFWNARVTIHPSCPFAYRGSSAGPSKVDRQSSTRIRGAVKQDVLQTGSLVGGALAALTSAAASICCIGPLAIMLLGVNGAIWAAGMKPYRPFLLTVSFVLLGLGFWGFYGRRKTGAGAACSVASRRVGRWVLWVSAVLWSGAVTIQFLADRFWL